MRFVRLLKPPFNKPFLCIHTDNLPVCITLGFWNAALALSITTHRSQKHTKAGKDHIAVEDIKSDHRAIGRQLSLFDTHISSPGAPFFQPDGTHIFLKLTSFLRSQYPAYGFREVLTPTIYKESLWAQSGHWANYKDDMFSVTGNSSTKHQAGPIKSVDGRIHKGKKFGDEVDVEQYGLKPMNCPGHCILYQSKRRSYRDLPIRYAEFSPLHRNEISGALSGLTRVRRFHQDDGHIFCRPSQVLGEILGSIKFIKMIYKTMHLKDYRFVLSTRPEKDYIGTVAEWDRAENQLKQALESVNEIQWEENKGDGAFYGPKIDVSIRDSNGKEHQTATIQLDFQLPKRFALEYDAPAPELEAKGVVTNDTKLRNKICKVTPVMIHRAVLGSLERFMALMLEEKDGKLPLWLSPRQMIILTVTDRDFIKAYAEKAKRFINHDILPSACEEEPKPREMNKANYLIDIDASGDSIAQKMARAIQNKYNMICVVGEKNVNDETMDVTFHGQPNLAETWTAIEGIIDGLQPLMRKKKAANADGMKLTLLQSSKVMKYLCKEYL